MFKVIEGIVVDNGEPGRIFGECGIYNSSCTVGYSGAPTKITLNVIAKDLETLKTHVNKKLLEVDEDGAGSLGHEVETKAIDGHKIKVGSVTFSNMYLYSYAFNVTAAAKTATLSYVDFSQAFDKIHVGLVGRHDTQRADSLIYKPIGPDQGPNPNPVRPGLERWWIDTSPNAGNHFYHLMENVGFQVVCLECNSLNPRRLLWPGEKTVCDCVQSPANPCGAGAVPCVGPDGNAVPLGTKVDMQPGDTNNSWPWNKPVITPTNHTAGVANRSGVDGWNKLINDQLVEQENTAKVSRFVQVAGGDARGYWVSANLRTGNWKTAVNGGYVTIGREAFQETNCEIGKVEYYFQDLVNMIDELNIDHNLNDLKFKRRACSDSMSGTCYAASYTGTLREVITAWGADLSFDWTIDSTGIKPKLVAIDLATGANLDEVREAIETSFDGSQGGMIKNYSTNVTKENTYKSEPLVKFIKPPRTIQREHQHDQYEEAKTLTVSDAIGNAANLGRTYSDLYISMGLAKYSPEARLMWLSDQASNKRETQAWYAVDGVIEDGGWTTPANGAPQFSTNATYEWATPCDCDPEVGNNPPNCGAGTVPCGVIGNSVPLGTRVPVAYPVKTIRRQKHGVSPGGPIGFWKDSVDDAYKWRGMELTLATAHAESASVAPWPGNGTIGSAIKSGAFVSLGFFPLTTLTDNLRLNQDGHETLLPNQYLGVVSTKVATKNCVGAAPRGSTMRQPSSPAFQKPTDLRDGDPCTGSFDMSSLATNGPQGAQWTFWCKGHHNACPGEEIPAPGGSETWPDNMDVTFPFTQRVQAISKKDELMRKFKKQKGGDGNNLMHPFWQNPDSYEVWIGIYNEQYQNAVAQFDAELAEDFVGKYGMFYQQLTKSYNYCPEFDVGMSRPLGPDEQTITPPVHRFHQISLETATIPDSQIYSGHSYPFKKILKVNEGQFNPDSVSPQSDYSAAPLAGGRPWERGHTTLGVNSNKSIFDIEDNTWGTAKLNVDWALENPYNAGHVESTFGNELQTQILQSDLNNFLPIYSYFDGRRELNTDLAKLFNNYESYIQRGHGEYSGYRGGIAIVPRLDAKHAYDHKDPNFRNKPMATGFNGKKILEVKWGNGDEKVIGDGIHHYNWQEDLALGNINNPEKRHLPGGDDAFIYCSEALPDLSIQDCHAWFKQQRQVYWPIGHWRNPAPSAVENNDGSIAYIKDHDPQPVGVHPVTEISWPLSGPLMSGPTSVQGYAAFPGNGTLVPDGYDNPVGGLRIPDIQTNPKVFRNAERRARKWWEDSQPKQDCTLYCEENVVEDVCECKPYEQPNHGFLSYKSYVLNLKHLGRYVKIIYPVETTYSGYFSAKSTMRGTIAKQQQVVGRPETNPGNVMGSRVTEIDATSDINAIEQDANTFSSKIVAKTPQGDMQIYNLETYYEHLKSLSQDISAETETISVRLDGTEFAGLTNIMDAAHGLSSFSISLDGEGVNTDLTFADRPPKLPKRDTLLQKIGPRLTDGRMLSPSQTNIAGGAKHNY